MSPETQAKQFSAPRKTHIAERKAKVKEWGIGTFLTSLSGFLTAWPRRGQNRVSTLESTPGLRTGRGRHPTVRLSVRNPTGAHRDLPYPPPDPPAEEPQAVGKPPTLIHEV